MAKSKDAGFTAEERAAMQERAKELKAAARAGKDHEDGDSAVLAKIAEMTGMDRTIGAQVHAILREGAPTLTPRLWYGMPAYARDGKVVCFYQCAQKFNARYATLGFTDQAHLDDGALWPTTFAVTGDDARRGAAHSRARSSRRWADACQRRARRSRAARSSGWSVRWRRASTASATRVNLSKR